MKGNGDDATTRRPGSRGCDDSGCGRNGYGGQRKGGPATGAQVPRGPTGDDDARRHDPVATGDRRLAVPGFVSSIAASTKFGNDAAGSSPINGWDRRDEPAPAAGRHETGGDAL